MTLTRLIPMAGLAALALLLVAAALFLLLRDGGDQPLELTDSAAATATAVSDSPNAAAVAAVENPAVVATDADEPVRVYVAGAVQNPGVYTLNPGDRLSDAISAAGGIAATADLSPVNLALKVKDEGRYLIPDISGRAGNELPAPLPIDTDLTRKTANLLTGELSGVIESVAPNPDTADIAAETNTAAEQSPSRVDLNTAGRPQLESLPGIGPSRAQAIIAYREQNGPFVAAEELTAVAGIGSGIYENLQSLITVQTAP